MSFAAEQAAILNAVARVRPIADQERMEQFKTVEMASGGLALVLEPHATWEEFPILSKRWISRLGARLKTKPVMTCDECLVEVEVSGELFWITYDDFQSSIQLESKNPKNNQLVIRLREELQAAP